MKFCLKTVAIAIGALLALLVVGVVLFFVFFPKDWPPAKPIAG